MLRFGVFTDAHYAKGKQYMTRYCELSAGKLARAVEVFVRERVDFVVNLGDIIDGAHGDGAGEIDRSNYRVVRRVLDRIRVDVHHVLGNHDLDSLTKAEALEALGATERRTWYSFSAGGCLFIVLDANFRSDGTEYARGNYEWTDTALSSEQIEWLKAELSRAPTGPVVVFMHQNTDDRPTAEAHDPHVIVQAATVREILAAPGRRVAVLQGHYHPGLHRRVDGVDYVTLRAMCEGDGPHDNSFAVVEIGDDSSVTIRGFEAQTSYALAAGPGAAASTQNP